MKLIIAGSRDITGYKHVEAAVAAALDDWSLTVADIREVVSGCARGVDHLGEFWADNHGVAIRRFPANINRWGRSGEYRRNEQMAEYAGQAKLITADNRDGGGGLVVVWDGRSKGSIHMLEVGVGKGLRTYLYTVYDNERMGKPDHPLPSGEMPGFAKREFR